MTFTVQVKYGMGAHGDVETTQGFNDMDDAYSFAEKILEEVAEVVRDGAIADNAVIRIWRDDKSFNLINSCTKGCS
jgi:hypothetical protein